MSAADGLTPLELPKAVFKLVEQANRAHRKALATASNAVEHAVQSGEFLAKARELCRASEWGPFVADNFDGSLRTAQKYIRLARNVRLLQSKGGPRALSSQNEAAKALTTIISGDSPAPNKSGSIRTRRARGASCPDLRPLVDEALALLLRVETFFENNHRPDRFDCRDFLEGIGIERRNLALRLTDLCAAIATETPPAAAQCVSNGDRDEAT